MGSQNTILSREHGFRGVGFACDAWIVFVLGGSVGAAVVLRFGDARILGATLLLLAVIFGDSIVEWPSRY
jgi:uncharacterized membrane protein YoaK (UPF0700 family)